MYAAKSSQKAGRRARIAIASTTAYVIAAAFYSAGQPTLRGCVTAALATGFAFWAARSEPNRRAPIWGLAIVIASLGSARAGWVDLLGGAGALVCSVSMPFAVAFAEEDAGLAAEIGRRMDRRGDRASEIATAVIAMTWALALTARGLEASGAHSVLASRADMWGLAAPIVTGIVIALIAVKATLMRRLELAASARARAALAALLGVFALTVGMALAEMGSAAHTARFGIAVASILVSVVASTLDVVRVERGLRRVVALSIVGGPIVLFGVILMEGRPRDTSLIAAVFGALTMILGASIRVFEEPLRPAQGRLLDAIVKAREAIACAAVEDAPREALMALRAIGGPRMASPEIWTFAPSRVIRVDAAGYAHEREEAMPAELVALASNEPEGTLRTEVLEALEVRRADLRPLAKWMSGRGAMSATIVARANEIEGLLVVPQATRNDPLSVEEARTLKLLADALASVCATRSALARGLDRDRELQARAEEADEIVTRFRHDAELDVGRNILAASRLARPATVGMYSAASSAALDATDRRVRAEAPIVLVAPSGVDPVPYVARAHLQGPRKTNPLVLVDGTSSREHDPARWHAPLSSPLALAHRGRLVLLDGAALPREVQQLIARALTERRPPWERAESLDITLAFTGPMSPSDLLAAGRLDPLLAARLGDASDAPIVLPRLRDRPDDLRAIVIDRLAREGLRVRGRPLGIDDAAFARIVEHTFPGEDAELASWVQRFVEVCHGDVVTRTDVEAAGFAPITEAPRRESKLRSL